MARRVSRFDKFVVANFIFSSKFVMSALQFELERYSGDSIDKSEIQKILKQEVFDKEITKKSNWKMHNARVRAHFVGLNKRAK